MRIAARKSDSCPFDAGRTVFGLPTFCMKLSGKSRTSFIHQPETAVPFVPK